MGKYIYEYYGQRQQPWAPDRLGFSTSTIHDYGCLVASISMMIHKDPRWTNERLKETKQFNGPNLYTANVNWDLAFDGRVVQTEFYRSGASPMPSSRVQQLREWTEEGHPAIVQLDFSPSSGLQTHYAPVSHVNAGGMIFIYDPWYHQDDQPQPVTRHYGKGGYGYNLYTCTPYGEETPPPPDEGYHLGQTTTELKVRAAPSTTATVHGKLPKDAVIVFEYAEGGKWARIPLTSGGAPVMENGAQKWGYSMVSDAGTLYIKEIANAKHLQMGGVEVKP